MYEFLVFPTLLICPTHRSVLELTIPTIVIHTDGVSTLSWWWGLGAAETLRAMPAVA
jgi:hypothetical protein